MKDKELLKQFIRFLKRYDAYDEYLNCLRNYKGEKDSITFIIETIKLHPKNMINAAFAWTDSKNIDTLTWAKLNDSWIKLTYFIKRI